jgi:iron complex outermembrane receptor protein
MKYFGWIGWILTISADAQDLESLKGTLMAENGTPLSHISLQLEGTRYRTMSDSNGNFHLLAVPTGQYIVRVTGTGWITVRKKVTVPGAVTITLRPETRELEQVVVTAVASNTVIRKTPVSIVAVSQKELMRTFSTNPIEGLLKSVPGLSTVTTGPNISKPFIRGLGYNRVLTLYDGMRQEGQQWGDEHGIEADPYSLTRVEVVKGPASLLYGSDAITGVVNLIPGAPAETAGQLKGDITAEYQSNNALLAMAAHLYAGKKNFSWSLRGSIRNAKDYSNPVDNHVYNTGFLERNAALTLGWNAVKSKQLLRATLYDNLQEIPDGSRDSLSRRFTYQVYESGMDDIRNRRAVTDGMLHERTIADLHQHIQHYRIYYKGNFQLGNGELSSLIGWQQNIRREFNHPTQTQQAGMFVDLQTLNYEIRYQFPEWQGIRFTQGMNGMYQVNINRDATDFPIPDYSLFDMGHFLIAKKELGKQAITGGIRWDYRQIRWPDFYSRIDPVSGFAKQVHTSDTSGAMQHFASFRQNFNGISGSLGWVYNPSHQLTFKINFATGYRCPSIPEIGSAGLDPGAHIYYIGNRDFVPETNWQADAGVLLDQNEWEAGAEVFYNLISHYIFLRKLFDSNGKPLEIVPGNFTYQYQQGSASLYGAEYHINLHPSLLSGLQLHHSLNFVKGINTDAASLKLLGDDAKYLPLLPSLQTMNRLRWQSQQNKKSISDLYLQLEYETHATQNRFYAVDQTETATPGYQLVHLGGGFSIRNAKGKNVYQFLLSVNNLFNTAYQSHQNRLKYFEYYQSSPNGRYGIYNMGRNISVKCIISW